MKSLILVTIILCNILPLIYSSKLYTLKSPSYFKFDYDNVKSIKSSEFKNLIAAVLGYGHSLSDFQGLKSQDPLNYPKVQIIILHEHESDNFGNSFKVKQDNEIDFNTLHKEFKNKDGLKTHYEHIDSLSNAVDDKLKDLSGKCKSHQALVFTIGVDNKNTNIDNGVDKLLNQFYNDCSLTDDDYLIYVYVTEPSTLSRVARQANPVADVKNITNKAIFYDSNYPVTFNILFWTSLFIGLFIFGAAYLLCSMDPGTDTVIYRMTTQRIKKDQ